MNRNSVAEKFAAQPEFFAADEIGPDDKTGTAGFCTESVAPYGYLRAQTTDRVVGDRPQ